MLVLRVLWTPKKSKGILNIHILVSLYAFIDFEMIFLLYLEARKYTSFLIEQNLIKAVHLRHPAQI